MPVNPIGTLITFTNAASTSVSLYASEVTRTKIIEPFTRVEFSNDKLRGAKNDLGGLPMIVTTIANTPIQLSISCAGDSPRPLTPDSISNLNSINQKFVIDRFTMRGTPQDISSLEVVLAQAIDHENRLQKFVYHATKANSDISYNDLVALQSETFSYLTSTGVSIAGNVLGGTYTNMLIVSFDMDFTHEVRQRDGSVLRLASWSMVIDQRAISSQAS